MRIFLKVKHWQLFTLLVGPPLILQIVLFTTTVSAEDPFIFFRRMIYFFPFVMIITMFVFFGWFYALGTNLHKKLPGQMKMNLTKFKIFLSVPIIYIFLICLFIFFLFNLTITKESPPNLGLFALIIPVHLFSMFCIFYCLYFNAKALKAVELQRLVTFSDFAGEFFLIWFYPIGIWIIQPRINKIFSTKE